MHDLVPLPSPRALISDEQAEAESVARYQAAEKAASTRRAYRSDAKAFAALCRARGLSELPASADTVCLFLAHSADSGGSMQICGVHYATAADASSLFAGRKPR